MKKLALVAIAILSMGAWFSDVEKQDIPDQNILSGSNPGGENGLSKWVVSTGSITAETANPGFGASSISWDAGAASETLRTADVVVPDALEGQSCLVEVYYKLATGSSGDIVLRVELDDGTAITTDLDLSVSSTWVKAQMGFVCPTNDSIHIELASTVDSGAILIDNAYLGRDFRLGVSNEAAEIVANAEYAPTSGCDWITTSASLAAFPTDAGCPAITVNSSTVDVNTTDDNLPNIVFDSLPAGTYTVAATFTLRDSTASNTMSAAISDGTVTRGGNNLGRGNGTNEEYPMHLYGVFDHTGGAKTFSIQGKSESGGNVILINNNSVPDGLTFTVTKMNGDSSTQVTLDTQEIAFRVRQTVNQTGLVSAAITKALFQTEDFDTAGKITGGTFTPGVPGKYLLTWNIRMNAGSSDQLLNCGSTLYKNGAGIIQGNSLAHTTTAFYDDIRSPGSIIVEADADDYFEVYASCATGSGTWSIINSFGSYFSGTAVSQNFPQAVAIVLPETCDINQEFCSGSYTPGIGSGVNVTTGSNYECSFMKMGNMVTVFGQTLVDPISTGANTRFNVTLPIATDITVTEQLTGSGAAFDSGVGSNGIRITGDAPADEAEFAWHSVNGANKRVTWSFSYRLE